MQTRVIWEAFRMEMFHRFLKMNNNFEAGGSFSRREMGLRWSEQSKKVRPDER